MIMDFNSTIKSLSHEEKAKLLADIGDFVQTKSGLWLPPTLNKSPGFTNGYLFTGTGHLENQLGMPTPEDEVMAQAAAEELKPVPPAMKVEPLKLPELSPGIKAIMDKVDAKIMAGFGIPVQFIGPINTECDCPTCTQARLLKKYAHITDRDERLRLYGEAIATTLPPEIEKGRERIGQLLAIQLGCFEQSISNLARYHGLPRRQRLPV